MTGRLPVRIIFLLFVLVGCSLPNQPGPQPTDIIPTTFEPGFNILGVIRVDGTRGSSFVHVQRAFRVEEATETFNPVIRNATVSVRAGNRDSSYAFTFVHDSLRGDIYTHPTFRAAPGQTYRLLVSNGELPNLSAATVTPPLPMVEAGSMVIEPQEILFAITNSSEARLYQVNLICETAGYSRQQMIRADQRQAFRFPLGDAEKPVRLEVYAYDAHLTEYLTAAITIKPQTYAETVTTVEGGYGCFGAVSKTEIPLK